MESEEDVIFQGNYPYPQYAPWWLVEEGKSRDYSIQLDEEEEEIGVEYDVNLEVDYDP